MLNGNDYCSKTTLSEMVKCNYKDRKVFTFTHASRNLYADLHDATQKYPDNIAIVTNDGKEITYKAFWEQVNNFSRDLYHVRNIRKGDMVASVLYNSLDFCIALYATAKLGGVFIPISTKQTVIEWNTLLKQIPVKLLLVDKDLSENVLLLERDNPNMSVLIRDEKVGFVSEDYKNTLEEAPYIETSWEDDIILMFTSGTTAKSKGVVLTNFNVSNALMVYERELDVTSDDKTIIATPIYHITGTIALLALFIHCGATIYLHKRFDAQRVLQCSQDHGITLFHASPTVFIMLLANKEAFKQMPSLRMFVCGSANMPPQVILDLHEWLPNMEFRTVYGLTESTSVGTGFLDDAATSPKIGSSGLLVPGLLAKVVDDDNKELENGTCGELVLYGSTILDRYYSKEVTTLSSDGWFYTGDIAKFDDDGYIYIVDRKKDMINRGGEKIWSIQVENEIAKIQDVVEVALIALQDKKYGEVAMAIIKKKEKSKLDQKYICKYIRERMAKYNVPKYVVFVDEIPKTHNGKVDKKKLRKMFEDYQA